MRYRIHILLALLLTTGAGYAEQAPPAAETGTLDEAPPAAETGTLDEIAAMFERGVVPEPKDPVASMVDLATLQLEALENADAEKTLTTAIDAIEERSSRYDPALIEPLTLLGDARHGLQDYAGAVAAYERAVHVTRVTEGLLSPRQAEILYREAASHAAAGDFETANDRQQYAYDLLLREYGAYNAKLLPGLYTLAEWFSSINNVFAARGVYEHALEVASKAYGDSDPRLVPVLEGIADSYRTERFPPYQVPGEEATFTFSSGPAFPYHSVGVERSVAINNFSPGEEALQQIIRIQQENPATTTVDELVKSMLALADWHLLFEKYSRAYPLYEHVFQMGQQAGWDDARLDGYFGEPVPLYMPIPRGPELPPPALRGRPAEGFVTVGYSVNERGFVHDVSTLDSEPEGLIDFKVRRGFREARFRPRIEAGTPIATEDLTYRLDFVYFPSGDEKPKSAMAAEAPANDS